MAMTTIAALRGSTAALRDRGRPVVENTPEDWRDEAVALMRERAEDSRRMAKVIPMIVFVRASAEDVAAERAAGIVQLEVERIARRGTDPAA